MPAALADNEPGRHVMRKVVWALMFFSSALPGATHAEEIPRITFGEHTFVLKHRETLPAQSINEYFPPSESVESWRQLIAVRWFPHLADHRTAVGDLIQTLLAQNPQARFEAWGSDDGAFTGVDFVTWQDDAYVEFNIFIYRKPASGEGLLVHQYAARSYGADRRLFLDNLAELRRNMLARVVAYRFPDVIVN